MKLSTGTFVPAPPGRWLQVARIGDDGEVTREVVPLVAWAMRNRGGGTDDPTDETNVYGAPLVMDGEGYLEHLNGEREIIEFGIDSPASKPEVRLQPEHVIAETQDLADTIRHSPSAVAVSLPYTQGTAIGSDT
jgi:hypothetical protein